MAKAPNKFLAPVIIAGITVGFWQAHNALFLPKPKRTNSGAGRTITAKQ